MGTFQKYLGKKKARQGQPVNYIGRFQDRETRPRLLSYMNINIAPCKYYVYVHYIIQI